MEGRLIILLACVSVTLIVNTLILFLVFKIFGTFATKVTEAMHEIETGAPTRQMLAALQSTSENAVKVTGVVRDQLADMGPVLERVQAEHVERLAKLDVRFKLVFQVIHAAAATVDKLVNWPIRNIKTASAVFNGIITFLRGTESGADARPRR